MGYLYETYPFEMDTILEMLQREEISEKDALMKLDKLLAEKNKEKELEAPKNRKSQERKQLSIDQKLPSFHTVQKEYNTAKRTSPKQRDCWRLKV